MGMGGVTLATLLGETGMFGGGGGAAGGGLPAGPVLAGDGVSPLAPRFAHFPGKAKRVIHFFLNGGPSHVDTFDPKPALEKYAGKPLPEGNLADRAQDRRGDARRRSSSRSTARAASRSATSFRTSAQHVDDIAVIRSMKAEVPNHEPSLMLMNCGDAADSRPSIGAWVTYGLGSENQNLPGFIAMCPGGYPIKETENWAAASCPGVFQGTYVDSQHTEHRPADREHPQPARHAGRPAPAARPAARAQRRAPGGQGRADARLEARIQSFELAYRMQMEAADAFDISKEPQHVREMYGDRRPRPGRR